MLAEDDEDLTTEDDSAYGDEDADRESDKGAPQPVACRGDEERGDDDTDAAGRVGDDLEVGALDVEELLRAPRSRSIVVEAASGSVSMRPIASTRRRPRRQA
jgi:hypothetical protein